MTRIITVTSGKLGDGKTSVGVNLAARLAQCGQRVCLLDIGAGHAGVTALLGIEAEVTLKDLALCNASLDDVLVRDHCGFDIVPGGDDSDWIKALAPNQVHGLLTSLAALNTYDFILIDSSSAISQNILSFALASPEIILIITPGSDSLEDAYALLKLLFTEQYAGRIVAVVNYVNNHTIGRYSYDKFKEIASFYLEMQIPLLGLVREDPAMQQAAAEHQPLVLHSPGSVAAGDIGNLADQLLVDQSSVSGLDMPAFCSRYLQATGIDGTGEPEAPGLLRTLRQPDQGKQDLRNQLDYLSAQVDDLIAEIERLRAGGKRNAELIELSKTAARRQRDPCAGFCLAADLANDSEEVSLAGETFFIYHTKKSNGGLQRFACHSLDDNLEKPEPQTTSS